MPLSVGKIYIHVWVAGHYEPNAIDEGCIRVTTIIDLVERSVLAIIIQLTGSTGPRMV